MNILAQHGFGPKDKITRGVDEGLIAGAVLSPRYLTPEKMEKHVGELQGGNAQALMDPEFFATAFFHHIDPSLGSLEKWDYLRTPRRSELITGAAIPGIIEEALQKQAELGFQEWIAPNVYVPKADSIDAAIAINFITHTKKIAETVGNAPVFATLAVSRDAIINDDDFRNILDALTAAESPPDGYYILVGSASDRDSGGGVRSDIYEPEVIAGWMYMNYVLSINGARVLNGYCHLLSPLLGIAGAEACAHGWFSTLKRFSVNKYTKGRGGGHPPLIRYVSTPLLSYLKQVDYEEFKAVVPAVATGSSYDAIYEGNDPSRTEEALQSWEALNVFCRECCSGDTKKDIAYIRDHIEQALELWAELQGAGFSQDVEQNRERINAMKQGLSLFEEWAEIS